jgi:hypothetical protein
MMDSATPFNVDVSGGSGKPRSMLRKTLAMFSRQWPYIGFAIVLAVLNIILAICTMSYLRVKKEPLIFSVICFCAILGLAQFASLCYLFRVKVDDNAEPMMIDVGNSIGVVLLFCLSGTALTIPLPAKCYSSKDTDLVLIGRSWCNVMTTIAVSSWLAAIAMIIATVLTYVAVRKAVDLAKMPPPVLPEHAEAPVMRWLNRNEMTTERHNRHYP